VGFEKTKPADTFFPVSDFFSCLPPCLPFLLPFNIFLPLHPVYFYLTMNIYIANINFRAQEEQLKELFQQYGEVSSVKIVTDRETGRSRGFGFVEMPNDAEGKEAIAKLNGVEFQQRNLVVNEARPQKR
jgi:RNA recognition motif-containing protein